MWQVHVFNFADNLIAFCSTTDYVQWQLCGQSCQTGWSRNLDKNALVFENVGCIIIYGAG